MTKLHLRSAFTILIILFIILIPGISLSQNTDQSPQKDQDDAKPLDSKTMADEPGSLNLDDLKEIRTIVENAGDLSENDKKSILSFVDRAIIFREAEAQLRKNTEKITEMIKTAPERIKAIEAELDRPPAPVESIATAASGMQPDQLELHLRQLEMKLSDATTNLDKLTDRLNGFKDLPAKLQQDLADAEQQLLNLAEEQEFVPSPDEPAVVVKVKRIALTAEQAKVEAELNFFEEQMKNHDVLVALISAERDLAAREVARQETLVKNWQGEVQHIRELEAKKERVVAEEAKKLAVDLPPVIQKQLDINIELGKMLEKFTAQEAEIVENLELRKTRLNELKEESTLAREQVRYPLQTETIALALREHRRGLPSIENFHQGSTKRRVQMGDIRSKQLELDRRQRELAELDQTIERIIQGESSIPVTEIELLKTELRRLLNDRRELLKKLQAVYRRSFKNLQTLELIEQQITTKAEEEVLFLDEHLLWLRSAKSFSLQDLANIPASLQWTLNPHHWWQFAGNLRSAFSHNMALWILALLTAFTFIGLRRWAHRDLSRVAQGVYSVQTDSFVLTLRALMLAGRVLLGWPLLLIFVGWQAGKVPMVQDFTKAVSNGLILAAQILAEGLLILELFRKNGVATVHFKWPETVRKAIRRSLQWFIILAFTMTFIFAVVQTRNDTAYTDSLGRLALIIYMLGFVVWAGYMFRFSGEIVTMLKRTRPGGWLVRLRFIWYPLSVGVPLVLALLAGMGYYYSVSALYLRMDDTIALIVGLVVVKGLLLRWLFIAKRRLEYEEIRRKKEAEAEQPSQEQMPATGSENEALSIEEPEINLDQLYEQNRALLGTIMFFSAAIGLWLIWDDVLPALNFLEKVELWSYANEVEGVRQMVPITVVDLMIAAVAAIVTVVAAKNLPGLLEIILLNWVPMNAGSRHAVTTVCSYAITALGVVITFTSIGLKWSNIQWLIAALSVGLGFGLQEVVANFVCGLIVLFEQPLRIGDTVTIGDVNGTVSRIRIRATTIVDWDRKELIVPNKEFITGRLVNWSLSDNIIRIRIPIGIAYGSDTDLAEKLMLKTAKANPLVVDHPEPQAVFFGFGDNSLNFELRVFIRSIDDWIPMLHELNRTINREFRKADVTISFPQRDVHLDQIGPLEVKVVADSNIHPQMNAYIDPSDKTGV